MDFYHLTGFFQTLSHTAVHSPAPLFSAKGGVSWVHGSQPKRLKNLNCCACSIPGKNSPGTHQRQPQGTENISECEEMIGICRNHLAVAFIGLFCLFGSEKEASINASYRTSELRFHYTQYLFTTRKKKSASMLPSIRFI